MIFRILYNICSRQGAAINIQESPGTSERGGMSADVTAKGLAVRFPKVLHESRINCFAPCINLSWFIKSDSSP